MFNVLNINFYASLLTRDGISALFHIREQLA
jgi:hypothetical protein